MSPLNTKELSDLPMVYLHKNSTKGQLIYSATLLVLLLSLASLPLVKIELQVKSHGTIQGELEKTQLLAPANGYLTAFYLKENLHVAKNDLLLIVDPFVPNEGLALNSTKMNQLQMLLRDVDQLLKMTSNVSLESGFYRSGLQFYRAQIQDQDHEIQQMKHHYDRHLPLFQKKVITTAEFELHQYNYEKALSKKTLLISNFKQQWNTEKTQYHKEIEELQQEKNLIKNQQKNYLVKASINGRVTQVNGLQVGDRIYENQQLGWISPDAAVFAYVYVKPSAIAHIHKGQLVRFQIDSFSFQQWGILMGKVVEVGEEAIMTEREVYFKVKCQLNQRHLKLKNGRTALVKKGMTFTAGFAIANRSLWQILIGKANDLFTAKN